MTLNIEPEKPEPLAQMEADQSAVPSPELAADDTPLTAASEPLALPETDQPDKPEIDPAAAAAPLMQASEPLALPETAIAPAPSASAEVPVAAASAIRVTSAVKGQQGIELPTLASAPQPAAEAKPVALPKGIYALIAVNLLALIVSPFLTEGATSLIAAIDALILMGISIGLVFRLEPVRHAAAVLFVVSACLGLVLGISMLGMRAALNADVLMSRRQVQQSLTQSEASPAQRQYFDAELARQDRERVKTGRVLVVGSLYHLAIAGLSAGQAVYLRRPRVKAAFHKLQA